MKEKVLHFGSYVLVAVLATVATLTMVHLEIGLKPSKLDQLEDLIEEKFIEEADPEAAEVIEEEAEEGDKEDIHRELLEQLYDMAEEHPKDMLKAARKVKNYLEKYQQP